MSNDLPLVSIGLPTYNGGRYLREALGSLLVQDYANLEIIVSDNASSDDTLDIVREFAARDARLRILEHAANIGAPANFNLVFRESAGTYFMWAADDDRWAPTYVSRCVGALEACPDAVLASSRVRFIDEDGRDVAMDLALYDNPDLSSRSVSRRVETLLSRGAWYQVYGLIRREALARTRLHTNAYGADVVLLLELALLGPFELLAEVLFEYRLFESQRPPDRGAKHAALDRRAAVLAAPYTHLQEALSEAIALSALSRVGKARAWLAMFSTTYVSPTPIRGKIGREATTRLRGAVRDRSPRAALKYGALTIVVAVRRVARRVRRGVSGAATPSTRPG